MIRRLLIAVAFAVVAAAHAAPPMAPNARNTSAYNDCRTHFTVVVLGSSTAAGAGAAPVSMSWVNQYNSYLQSISPANKVIDLAVSGYTTYQVLPTGRVPRANRPAPDPAHNITSAIALKPNAIILSLPSNDIASGYSLEEAYHNFETIATAARVARIPLWVSTPQPRNLTADKRAQMAQLRAFINRTFGANALDFMSGYGTPDGSLLPAYSSDGTHPNNAGHAILFRRVVAAKIPETVCASLTSRAGRRPIRLRPAPTTNPHPIGWQGARKAPAK
ncbi:MAG TPA: SGNH/GDSL hydrolase family protein [Armatimonadota bacterium]|jgi:lysophospholipase L1-like esterase